MYSNIIHRYQNYMISVYIHVTVTRISYDIVFSTALYKKKPSTEHCTKLKIQLKTISKIRALISNLKIDLQK